MPESQPREPPLRGGTRSAVQPCAAPVSSFSGSSSRGRGAARNVRLHNSHRSGRCWSQSLRQYSCWRSGHLLICVTCKATPTPNRSRFSRKLHRKRRHRHPRARVPPPLMAPLPCRLAGLVGHVGRARTCRSFSHRFPGGRGAHRSSNGRFPACLRTRYSVIASYSAVCDSRLRTSHSVAGYPVASNSAACDARLRRNPRPRRDPDLRRGAHLGQDPHNRRGPRFGRDRRKDPKPPTQAPPAPAYRPPAQPAPPPATASPAILHEETPDVPHAISARIRGHVKVTVRVLVDPYGKVVGEFMENPGPSRYFARLASDAAEKWQFIETDNRSPRVWLLRFEFTRGGTAVQATTAQ